MKKAIILANGVFPKRDEALRALLNAGILICCDGAYNRLIASQLFLRADNLPEIHVVGDGDSLSAEYKNNPPFKTHFVDSYTDQETNDLTKAVKYAISLGVTHIVILGASGLREDHTLANISLLGEYACMSALDGTPLNVRIYSDYGVFTPLTASKTIASTPGQQVSLIALESGITVSSEGLKYPLENRLLHHWWEATLNEATGTEFRLEIEGKGVLLVYQTHR